MILAEIEESVRNHLSCSTIATIKQTAEMVSLLPPEHIEVLLYAIGLKGHRDALNAILLRTEKMKDEQSREVQPVHGSL